VVGDITTAVMAMLDEAVEEIMVIAVDRDRKTKDGSVPWRVMAMEDQPPLVLRNHLRHEPEVTGKMEGGVWLGKKRLCK